MIHELKVCVRQGKRQYHNCSHSDEFVCPVCGRACRQNLNYLGHRNGLYCDGAKFHRRRYEFGDYERDRVRVS